MKYLVIALMLFALVVAEKEQENDERPKTYRRLIPADVLRGELINIPSSFIIIFVMIF